MVEVGQGTSGITGARQVANLAYAFELPVAMMNCPGNFMAHLACALPNHMMMEVVDNGREPCFSVDQHVEDGFILLGETPGSIGLTIDEAKLAQIEVEEFNPPPDRISPAPRRIGAGLYEVPPTPEEVVWR